MRTQNVVATHDQIGTQMPPIFMQQAGSRGDIATDSGLSARIEALEFEVRTHEKVDELGVCSRAGSACVDVGSNVVNLFAIFFDDDGASGGSGICSEDNPPVKLDSDDGGPCFFVGDGFNGFFILQYLIAEWLPIYRWVRVKSKPPI